MANFDVTAYLEGELSEQDKANFEAEMKINPDLAGEVKLMRQITKDLETELIREKVTAALSEKPNLNDERSRDNKWTGEILGILVLAIAVFFFFNQDEEASPVVEEKVEWPNAPKEVPAEDEIETKKSASPKEKQNNSSAEKEKPKKQPIAESKPPIELPAPLYPSPNLQNVRGGGEENEDLKNILDQIWYMDFPPEGTTFSLPFEKAGDLLIERDFTKAYVRLNLLERKNPENDTLNFMKGYCLLELGQGEEAIKYFEKTNNPPQNWQNYIDWYSSLANIINEDIQTAKSSLLPITKNRKHLYHDEALKALNILNQ